MYSLDLNVLKAKLATAPSRTATSESSVIIAFPTPHGEMQNFKIFEASVMDPALAARYPEIQSYVGLGVDDKTARIRFSVTIFGLHTMCSSGTEGTWYIDPYSKDLKNYMVFNRSDLTSTKSFRCDTADAGLDLSENTNESAPLHRANNSLFKNYRLALACTIEYAGFHVCFQINQVQHQPYHI